MPEHPIPPIVDANSRILILGSFPSVLSRETMFFYGHPQNRFWKVLSLVYDRPLPVTIPEKKALLLSHGIALWDVIAPSEITGSSDTSIKNVIPNDLTQIFKIAPIRQIYVNGKTAEKYYNHTLRSSTGREAICLPSTSPANASWSLERLVQAWKIIAEE